MSLIVFGSYECSEEGGVRASWKIAKRFKARIAMFFAEKKLWKYNLNFGVRGFDLDPEFSFFASNLKILNSGIKHCQTFGARAI